MAGDFIDESELKLQGIEKYFNSYTKRGRLNWVLATYGTLFGAWAVYKFFNRVPPIECPPPPPKGCVPCKPKPVAAPKKQTPCQYLESLTGHPPAPLPPTISEPCLPPVPTHAPPPAKYEPCSCGEHAKPPPPPPKAPPKKMSPCEYLASLNATPPPAQPSCYSEPPCCSKCGKLQESDNNSCAGKSEKKSKKNC